MFRNTSDVLNDLKELINTPGFIYSLCMILHEDFHFDLNKMHEIDHRSKLSVKECSLIIGFLVQNEIDFSYPSSPEVAFNLKERTYELMRELQISYNIPQFTKIKDLFESQDSGGRNKDSLEHRLDFFVKDGGMIEPMFYSGDGVYDFQYLEYLQMKYKYDVEWLLQNKGFDIDQTIKIVKKIKQFFLSKSESIQSLNIHDEFQTITKKVKGKLKKKYSKEKINEIQRQQLISLNFYKYNSLFPNPIIGPKSEVDWEIFYQNLIELFTIKKSDFSDFSPKLINDFFKNFSFNYPTNENYKGPGHFNKLNSCPFVKLDEQRYFLPIGFLLTEAVYESPYYWMVDDDKYKNIHAKNRGEVGEEIAYQFLSKVFGEENTYKSVKIEIQKGKIETDIDVLCLFGNIALCIQVKSKKITLASKRGDFDQILKDFQGAVQDAYNQGIVSRENILSRKGRFILPNGKEIILSKNIKEVYILGITTENFPSLTHQVHSMLDKKKTDPYPLMLSIFDLELLTYYLKEPYEFLYYVRQRIQHMEYFRADEEIVFLGFHLKHKLWPIESSDGVLIDNEYGKFIDRNYYPYKLGVSHLLEEKDDPIANIWKDSLFEKFIDEIKSFKHHQTLDIIFHLFDWSVDTRKNLVNQFYYLKQSSIDDGITKSLATTFNLDFGFSYLVINTTEYLELYNEILEYSLLRKYITKSDNWLGLGTYSYSSNLIDVLIYLDEPWEYNQTFENKYFETLKRMKSNKATPIVSSKKIERNDPCPCKSGKKYKKCCGDF